MTERDEPSRAAHIWCQTVGGSQEARKLALPEALAVPQEPGSLGGNEALLSHNGCSKGAPGQVIETAVISKCRTWRLQSDSLSRTGITPLIQIKAICKYIKLFFLDPRGG